MSGGSAQPRKDPAGERGLDAWGLMPRGWGQVGPAALGSPLPEGTASSGRQRAQACASRARTCTLGRQNHDCGSSLLVLSSWNRMWRKKSPV